MLAEMKHVFEWQFDVHQIRVVKRSSNIIAWATNATSATNSTSATNATSATNTTSATNATERYCMTSQCRIDTIYWIG